MLAMKVSNLSALSPGNGYELTARFTNVGGLEVRAPVKMAGVPIGRVTDIRVDSETYDALVKLSSRPEYDRLPLDTDASIFTAGLLGEQYIGLAAGGDEHYLKDGDEIRLTQDAIILEQLIGQFMFNRAAEGVENSSGAWAPAAAGQSGGERGVGKIPEMPVRSHPQTPPEH